MKMISIDDKVIDVINNNPDIVDVLVDIGFVHLGNPVMLKAVGSVMTIRKAAGNHKIELEEIRKKLNENGYDFNEEKGESK